MKGKSSSIILALWILGLTVQVCHGQIFTVTPHDLLPEQKVVVEGESEPQWQGLWNEARKSALQGDFVKAERQYRALLAIKDNLEEARWELARLMMYLKRWQEAGELLELLIEAEPESTKYIIALGKIMWETTQYERAVGLFQKVYAQDPAERTALAGLVEGLSKLGRESEALPYLEQLVQQEPTNRAIRRYLAFLLYDAQDYEKARTHLTILARNDDVEFEVLYKTAKTYEHLGLSRPAAAYWERVLAREQASMEAHIFLAKYYEKLGQLDRSLSHLQAVVSYDPDDVSSYLRLARMYESSGEPDKALPYYDRYLARHPEDQDIIQRVAAINTGLAKRRDLTKSGTYPTDDTRAAAETLRQKIRDLDAAGRLEDVIPFYRQLIKISPDDAETLAALANDLIAIGKSGGKVSMDEFLSDIIPDNRAVYRSMAELLRRLDREEELLAVLHKIHELDPADNYTIQELAIIYLGRGEYSLSQKYFNELSGTGCWNARCLESRASLAEKLNKPAQRLHDYEVLLELQPNRYEIRFAVVALAAKLGFLDRALFHAGYLQMFPPIRDNLELKIYVADAYRKSGYLTRAVERYGNILEQASGSNELEIKRLRRLAWLGIARTYDMLGLAYETEQALRNAIAQEEDKIEFLVALFMLYLDTGRIAESDIWLQAINREIDRVSQDVAVDQPNLEWQKEFLQAQMYAAEGDHDLAIDLYREAESLLQEHAAAKLKLAEDNTEARITVQKGLAASLKQAGRYAEAEKVLLGLEDYQETEPELFVMLEQLYRAWSKAAEAEKIVERATIFGAEDFGRQLSLASLYGEYHSVSRQAQEAAKAESLAMDSLAAKLLHVEALMAAGEYPAALKILRESLKSYPENSWFLTQQAQVLARLGNFPDALGVTEMILADDPERRDIVLLQARIFWEMNRWKDSVLLYESIVEQPVEELLQEKIRELELSVAAPPAKTSWWDMLTFSDQTELPLSQLALSPGHAVDFTADSQAVNQAVSTFYARYRWQDQFNRELSVRRSVMRREYYHAANKLEKLIAEYGEDEFLLYDLAGLYSKLERLNDEAAIYRQLAVNNADFPGLSEATQRNDLKRRPQVFFAYTMQDDDGWDGYKAVRQTMYKGGGRFFQTTNSEWSFDVGRINYESTRDSQDVDGWRTMLTYDLRLSQALGISLGGGFTQLESGYEDTPLFYGAVTGKIADEMRAVFSISQDVVADTIASLKRNIKRRDYKIEVLFDLFPRLLLGGKYDLIDYSDNNWTNTYAFWAAYILLPEPTLLTISYNYDFYDSREGHIASPYADDGFGVDDHPYWSPLNYWITRFSFLFKHQLSNDTLARGIPSYYTIEYSLGYDTEDNDLHELKGSLNIEIARNYILSASYGYVDLDEYQHEEVLLSIMYRF